jgi:hypothetical protein
VSLQKPIHLTGGGFKPLLFVNGKTFMLNSPEFFGAMKIKPIVLDEKQVRDFLNNSKFGFTSLTIKR